MTKLQVIALNSIGAPIVISVGVITLVFIFRRSLQKRSIQIVVTSALPDLLSCFVLIKMIRIRSSSLSLATSSAHFKLVSSTFFKLIFFSPI